MNPHETTRLSSLFRRNIFVSICTILCLLSVAGLWILSLDVHSQEILSRERSQEGAAMDSTLVKTKIPFSASLDRTASRISVSRA